jgi:hypothetical protein
MLPSAAIAFGAFDPEPRLILSQAVPARKPLTNEWPVHHRSWVPHQSSWGLNAESSQMERRWDKDSSSVR